MKIAKKITFALALTAIAIPVSTLSVQAATTLNGSGSTFVWNLVDACRGLYARSTISNTLSDTVEYSGGGSGQGKKDFTDNVSQHAIPTKQWAATDSLYSTDTPVATFAYVPLTAGAISVMYHVEGVTPANTPIRLTSNTIAKIFAGTITTWNDAAIQASNTATIETEASTIAAKTTYAVKRVSKNGVSVVVSKSGLKVNFTITATSAGLSKYSKKNVSISKVVTVPGRTTTTVGATVLLAKSATKSLTYSANTTFIIRVGNTLFGTIGVDNTVIPAVTTPAVYSGTTLTLPATPIKVYYRSSTSGTTNNFTKFLHAVEPSIWTNNANDSFSTAFPGTVTNFLNIASASGSDGVANQVVSNNGGITYTELSFVNERLDTDIGIRSALVKNNANVYVAPSAASAAAFYADATAATNGSITADYTVASSDAYLISAIAYGLGYTEASTANTAVRKWFTYILNVCSPQNGAALGYAPLTGSLKTKALAQAAKVGAG